MRKAIARSLSLILIASSVFAVPIQAHADAGPAGSLVYPINTGANYSVNTSARYQIVATGLTAPLLGEFTYEAWFQTTLPQGSAAAPLTIPNQTILGTRSSSGDGNNAIDVTLWRGALNVSTGGGSAPVTTANYTIAENQWYHFAYVRKIVSGVTTTSLYLNGALVTSNANGVGSRADFTTSQTSTQITIGTKGQQCCANDSGEAFQGYLSNIRVSNTAEYRTNFTPSGPLTPTVNTQVLLNTTNDANKIKNSAGNAVTFSITGVASAALPASSSASPFSSPTLSSLTVASGSLTGGTSTTILGTNLNSTSGVRVGGTTATGVVVNSSTSVTFVTPSGSLGAQDVVVSTMLGNFTLTGAFTYGKNSQTISFDALTGAMIGVSTPSPLNASASSGLPVSFSSSTPGTCGITGSTISMLNPGLCTITASQAGDATYASVSANQSFSITAKPKNDDQKELMELLAIIPQIGSLSLSLGNLATSNIQKCVRGKVIKKIKLGAKCPKGYVKKK